MKTGVMPALLALLVGSAAAFAQTPSVSASFQMHRTTVYEREIFDATLTIEYTGAELDQRMDLAGMPDSPCLKFGDFKELSARRIVRGNTPYDVKSFRTTVRAIAPGSVQLAPTLRVNLVQSRPGIVGSVRVVVPTTVPVQARTITIRPLPPTPPDLAFSGAVGAMRLDVTVAPTNLALGELVTITTRVIGKGWTDDMLPPRASPGGAFRAYDPKPLPPVQTEPPERRFEQILVPQSKDACVIPPISFTYFDPAKGMYETVKAGPFALHFHDREAVVVVPYRPTPGGAEAMPARTSPWLAAWQAASPAVRVVATGLACAYWLAVVLGTGYLARRTRRGTLFGLVAIAAAALLFLAACSLARDRLAARPVTQVVRPEPARLHPAHTALTLFTIPADGSVKTLESFNSWTKVEYEGNRGWVPASAIRKSGP